MAEAMFAEVREEAGIDENYRPLSGLAVAGFLVSWLSVAAFYGTPLWSVAGLAIVLNLAALRHTAVTSRKGAALARAGLMISVFLLTAAVSCDWMHDFVNERQAKQVADDWIAAMFAGDLRQAHQLSLVLPQRQPKDQLQAAYDASPSLRKDLEGYGQIETVRKVTEFRDGADAPTAVLESVEQESDAYREGVKLRYELRSGGKSGRKTQSLVLPLIRERAHAPHLGAWRINLSIPLTVPSEMPPPEPPPARD
jgi:hypothetical protein